MKIAIMGTGAMGGYIGARLAEARIWRRSARMV